MTGYLLDTNVVSETRKPRPHPRVLAWLGASPGQLFLSVVVIGELTRGAEQLRGQHPDQADGLDGWVSDVEQRHRGSILPVTVEIGRVWGRLDARQRLPTADGLLAATALVHDLTLVTRNTRDVERTGVKVLNPFSG